MPVSLTPSVFAGCHSSLRHLQMCPDLLFTTVSVLYPYEMIFRNSAATQQCSFTTVAPNLAHHKYLHPWHFCFFFLRYLCRSGCMCCHVHVIATLPSTYTSKLCLIFSHLPTFLSGHCLRLVSMTFIRHHKS